MRATCAIVAMIGALALASSQSAHAQLASSPWPMFGHDPRHTGLSPFDTGANPGKLKWKFNTREAYSSPAIGADGTIYVLTTTRLYAINFDGTEKWEFDTPGGYSSPAIGVDGTIYIGSAAGNVYAIRPDGTEKWQFTTGSIPFSSPAIGADGTIYIGSNDFHLYAINPDGSLRWKFKTSNFALWESSPAIGGDGTIYVGPVYQSSSIFAINPDGTQRWEFSASDGNPSSATLASDGTVYVGFYPSLLAINSDGSLRWTFITVTGEPPAIAPDGTIYVVGNETGLYAINPDGSQKWVVPNTGNLSSPAISGSGAIYVGSTDGNVYAINPDGTESWKFATGGELISSPAIGADGTVYVSSFDADPAKPGNGLFAVGRPAALRLSTLSIDFGAVGTDTGIHTKSFSIKDVGQTALRITANGAGLPAPPFKAAGPSSFKLLPRRSNVIVVTFSAPKQPGAAQGEIVVSADDGEVGGVTVKALVEGPSLSAPTTLEFGAVKVGQSRTMPLIIKDSGLGVLTGSIDTSGLKPPWSALSASVGGMSEFTIAHGGSSRVNVRFAPRAVGSFSGTITITSNDPNNPHATVMVQGAGE